jgi:hypothetical protein
MNKNFSDSVCFKCHHLFKDKKGNEHYCPICKMFGNRFNFWLFVSGFFIVLFSYSISIFWKNSVIELTSVFSSFYFFVVLIYLYKYLGNCQKVGEKEKVTYSFAHKW